MRVGLVCPYTWDVPGGVQAHVRDLAEALIALGHSVSVLTPADDEAVLPPYAVGAGRAIPVPYNGSVARLLLGPVSATRVRRWLRDGDFDVLHVHEPVAPSISLLACWLASGPIVATFHTSNPRSRILTLAQGALQTALEKISGRIAVSEAARRTTVEHLGGDAVLIPNGVAAARFAAAEALPGMPDGRTVLFLGRVEEPRKGLSVLLEAFGSVPAPARLFIAGPGSVTLDPALAGRAEVLGLVDEEHKARLLRSADIFVAPNTGMESFGIVLLEALAAGAPLVASDLDAFRRVLDGSPAAELVAPEDPAALAAVLGRLLGDPAARARMSAAGPAVAARYDWRSVAAAVLEVYQTVTSVGRPGRVGLDPNPVPVPVPAEAVAADGLTPEDPQDAEQMATVRALYRALRRRGRSSPRR